MASHEWIGFILCFQNLKASDVSILPLPEPFSQTDNTYAHGQCNDIFKARNCEHAVTSELGLKSGFAILEMSHKIKLLAKSVIG